jgi:hypothetical protein
MEPVKVLKLLNNNNIIYMMEDLLYCIKKTSVFVFLLSVQFIFGQKITSDEKLLHLVDKHIDTPIKTIVLENGDVFLQRDMSAFLENATATKKYNSKNELISSEHTDEGDDHKSETLNEFLNKPQASVKTMEKYFAQAAAEFQVPIEILKAVGQVQSNWAQVPASMYGSYGVMGLIENQSVQQITLGAKLANITNNDIIIDAKSNIRAAAALLTYYQKDKPKSAVLEDWFESTRELTGLTNEEMKTSLATRFYTVIKNGSKSVTNWKEIIVIEAKPLTIPVQVTKKKNVTYKTALTVDYALAKPRFSLCDTSNSYSLPNPRASDGTPYLGTYAISRNGSGINYYFVHYMATGTYEGAISYFSDCYRTSQSSANYCIRNADGEISQVVSEAHRAFAQGVTEYNNGGISTEHEVLATNLAMWDSEPMLVSSANLAIDACNRNGIARTRRVNNGERAIYGHSDVRATDCPNLTQPRWDGLMARISGGVIIPSVAMPTLYTVMNPGNSNQLTASWKANSESTLLGYRLYYATDESQVTWALAADETTLTALTTSITLDQSNFKVVPVGDVYHFRLTAVVPNGTEPKVESLASDVYSRSSNTTGPKVLIVDGFDRIGAYTKSFHNFATSFFNELKSNATLQINTSANEKVEDGTILLTNYDMVFWFTGDDSSANIALSANEKTKIRTYLESGGKLVLSGSEIAYNLGRSAAAAYDLAFMNGYLKSSYVGDGVVGDTPAVGITGTAFEGVSCAIGSIYVDRFPDNITAFGGATNVFSYTTAGRFGGIVYTGLFGTSTISSQLIYVGFGIENISPSDRANFMKKALTYFNVTLDVNEIVFIEKNKITAYPNPFNNLFEINFNTTIPNNGNITIYDVTGKQVWEQNFKNNTEGKIVVSTNALSNGLYFVKISLENGTSESFKMIKQN